MTIARVILRSGKGRVLLAALVCAVAWQVWLSVEAPGKISPELRQASSEKVDVLITLRFPPERFHVLTFQRYGRVSGTQDNSIEVRGVKKADLLWVARRYWVDKMEPLPKDGTS